MAETGSTQSKLEKMQTPTDEQNLKIECIKMAISTNSFNNEQTIVEAADAFYEYVRFRMVEVRG